MIISSQFSYILLHVMNWLCHVLLVEMSSTPIILDNKVSYIVSIVLSTNEILTSYPDLAMISVYLVNQR